VNKALGSLNSRNHLPQTISYLLAMSKSQSTITQLGAMQSIWNTIETSGIGLVAHVDSVLQHMVTLFFTPIIGASTEQKLNKEDDKYILLGYARILYALIALGPDVIFKPQFGDVFKLLVHDILSSDIASVQIEATRLVKRSILLAPMLIPNLQDVLVKVKQFLIDAPSHSDLKKISANCIKLIAEKEMELVCGVFQPKMLFQILDQFNHEVEGEDCAQDIKQIISLMIQTRSYSPSDWVTTISQIVACESRRGSSSSFEGGLISDTDDAEKGATVTSSNETFSWQVKVFAMKCLDELVNTYSTSAEHTTAKIEYDSNDYLVQHLGQIINTCSIALSKGTFSMKYYGLHILLTLIKVFELTADPEAPEDSILQIHDTRFGTAISLGFEPKNPPMLSYAACQLASLYIPSRIIANQPSQMTRMCSFLTEVLSSDLNTNQYGEIAATMIRVAVLASLATIYNTADESKNTNLLNILEPHFPNLFDSWEKLLRDYGHISVVLDDSQVEYVPIDEDPTKATPSIIVYRGTFLDEGTESSVFDYFRRAYPSIINAITRLSSRKYALWKASAKNNESVESFAYNFDISLVMGIAVRALYENKINDQTMPIILSCIHSVTRMVSSDQFKQLPFAPGIAFELFLLLSKTQARDLGLQYACLKLLNTIVHDIDATLLSGSGDRISTQAIVTTSIEVCLKPIRLHFPTLFEQDSEQNRPIPITKEQAKLVRQCMSCLKTIVERFKESVNGASITTILYSLCRILQYTRSSSCLDVAMAMMELEVKVTSISTLDEISVWILAFESAIDNLLIRIRDFKLTTSLEIELLFVCLACIQKASSSSSTNIQLAQLAAIHDSVTSAFLEVLSDSRCLTDSNNVRKLSWILTGLQNGLLRLAKTNVGSELALFYFSQLSGPVSCYLLRLFDSGRITNDQFDRTMSVSPAVEDGEESQLILAIIPAGLNILLAGYSLTELSKKTSYLFVMIPLLVSLLRTVTSLSSSLSQDEKRKENLDKIHKLAVQCLERVALSTEQFTQVVRSLPSGVIAEIKQEVRRSKEKNTKPVAKSAPKHQKLQINFDAYVTKK